MLPSHCHFIGKVTHLNRTISPLLAKIQPYVSISSTSEEVKRFQGYLWHLGDRDVSISSTSEEVKSADWVRAKGISPEVSISSTSEEVKRT